MIDFPRSFFTWKTFPRQDDPYYKYAGGFIGKEGDVRHVRFNLESRCTISDSSGGQMAELFVGAPCRTEYTIPRRGFFQIPGGEFRMAFSRTHRIPIARRPSSESEAGGAQELSATFQEHSICLKENSHPIELHASEQVVEATLANALLNALCTYSDPQSNLRVTVEYPVNLINRQPQGRHLPGLHRAADSARSDHLGWAEGRPCLPGPCGHHGFRLC